MLHPVNPIRQIFAKFDETITIMLGAIIGDTVGSVYEFNNTKAVDFPLFSSISSYTDDSLMSLAVAKWLTVDKTFSHNVLEKVMVEIASTNKSPMGGYGVGFVRWLFGKDRRPYNSWGNGSAMRVSAVGWMFDTLEETERVAEISASITHNHPEGIKGAQATAAAIFMARTGSTKEEIRSYIQSHFGYDLSKTWNDLHPTYGWDESCQGTVPPAIIAFLDSNDFEGAIRLAVSLGGDSDTLACITGGIAEAFYRKIPKAIMDETLTRLPAQLRDMLESFAASSSYRQQYALYKDYNLERFHDAQDRCYQIALEEVRKGYKSSHWIWYIFPQIKGLGSSPNAIYYGISGLDEARAYLADETLGPRLKEITAELLRHSDRNIHSILGGIDSLKLKSSMTLFDLVSQNDIFAEVLKTFFEDQRDILTLEKMAPRK